MSSSLLRLVTVDVTNTLIRVAGSPGRQYAYIGRKYNIDMDEELLNGVFPKLYKKYTHLYPNFGAEHKITAYDWWGNLVKDCFRYLDPSIEEKILEKVANHLFFHYTTPMAWEFIPGAMEAIQDLHRYPVKLGVISNWDQRLYKVLNNLQLRPYFDFVLPSYVIGVEKPDSGIFHKALQDARCKPSEAVHFGDNIEKDFIGARKVGMEAYLLSTKGVLNDFLHEEFVVESVQGFVNLIRPRLGDLKPDKKEPPPPKIGLESIRE